MSETVLTLYIDESFSEFTVKLDKEIVKQRSITRGPPKEGDKDDPTDGVESSHTAE